MKLANFGLAWSIFFLMATFLFPQFVEAIEIHDIRWGFNGSPVAFKINPVTILVENTDPVPFESDFIFHQETFRGQQIDITLSTSTYIAPFEKKWLQFYPYLMESNSHWNLSWQSGNKQHSQSFLSPQVSKELITVQLVTPNSLSKAIPGIKQYPEDLFPPFLGAIDSLDTIILDHVPKWEKSRRTAFMQWIFTGGTVHLFQNSNGNPLTFPDSFLPLNSTTSTVHFGNGIIYRHQNRLDDLPSLELKQLIMRNNRSLESQFMKGERATSSQNSNFSYDEFSAVSYNPPTNDEEILATLNDLSKPKQIWYFIFLLSFIYLIVAGPGYYLITKISNNHFTFYGVYLLSTAIFCFIFLIIGQYSANRTSKIHSLIIANILPENEIDITEWSSLGIASGGNFTISHLGDSHIYSTCQQYSKVNGIAISGREGRIQVDIPTNSSRTFFHRGKTTETIFGVKINSFLTNDLGIEVLSLGIDNDFPQEIDQIHFLYGAKLYELKKEKDQLKYRGTSRNLRSVLSVNPLHDEYRFTPKGISSFVKPQDLQNSLSIKHLAPILLQRALKLSSRKQGLNFQLTSNHGKLLVFSSIPDKLFPESPDLSRKEGLVLYCLDVPLTGQAG
ncbi:hypothetical protein V144x_01540 [Gimesia aquarii]|uniref:Uncharacterized protein n=2 Tax=Gimesia aquarii TaxID=2527964 RepID=A0A517VP23_9PLAN|nr:hypothetical protein V144x_01540 [Gimesia aquarii]